MRAHGWQPLFLSYHLHTIAGDSNPTGVADQAGDAGLGDGGQDAGARGGGWQANGCGAEQLIQ